MSKASTEWKAKMHKQRQDDEQRSSKQYRERQEYFKSIAGQEQINR